MNEKPVNLKIEIPDDLESHYCETAIIARTANEFTFFFLEWKVGVGGHIKT